MKRGFLFLLCAGLVGILPVGCASYDKKASEMRNAWRSGNFAVAESIAAAEIQEASETDRLVWELDKASILRGMQKTAEAELALENAARTLEAWDEQADVLISKEAGATLLNLTVLPYRGRGSDRILLQTYRALNFLEAGKTDAARVALNAAFRAQAEAVERNEKEILAAQEAAAKESVDIAGLEKNSKIAAAIDRKQAPLADVAPYADYVNPFTTWLHGIYFLRAGADGSDHERGRKSLERVAAMVPENAFVREDCDDAQSTRDDEALTYVIFEYGVAPHIREKRLDLLLPIPIGNGRSTIAPVSIALPELVREGAAWLPLMTANGVPAQTLCDMSRVLKTDFENAYPAVLSRTLTTAFLKTAASVAANIAAQEYAQHDDSGAASLVMLGTLLAGTVFTYSSAEADVRAWQTLPENFSLVRLKTPDSRQISVEVGGRSRDVKLLPGKINVVLVKTVGVATEPSIAQFILCK